MTLGPRILKTGISVTVALYICYFLQLEQAVFAGVAAIFAVQPSIYRTWKYFLDQLITNTLGAAVALFAIHFIGNDPIIIGLVLIMVILVCLQLKMESNISLTLVTVLAVMSAPGTGDWTFAITRFLIILIGISSAFLVNLAIFPPKYKKNYLESSEKVFQNMSLLMRTAISDELTEKSYKEEFDRLTKDISKLEELFILFNEERSKMAKLNPLDAREIVVFKQMLRCLQQGEEVLQIIEEHYFQIKKNHDINVFFDQHLEALTKQHEYLLLKYQGKVKTNENHLRKDILDVSGTFLEDVIRIEAEESMDKQRLITIGSSIFEYSFHLQRLNKLIHQYLKIV